MGCCHPSGSSEIESHKPSKSVEHSTIITSADFVRMNTEPIEKYYDLQEIIGSGGYGEVYKAMHRPSSAVRAIKSVAMFDEDTTELDKIMKEVSILKMLDHPNIIRIYEVFLNKNKLFIVTELCTGGELFDRIKEMKNFSENQAAKYMHDVTSAVMHCHKHGVVHRDLKPENLLLETKSSNSKLKLIDFGTSTTIKTNKKMRRTIGTYYYMAPEVISGEYDAKCDVWSLGVILYIMLSGFPPFNGRTDNDIIMRIQSTEVSFANKVWNGVSDEVKNLITKMLKKNPEERASIDEVFNHPWIQSRFNNRVPDIMLEESALENLSNFNVESKLQQAIQSYIVSQMLDHESFSKLRDVFMAIDKDGDGLLSKVELEKAVEKFALRIDVKELLARCDHDKNGYINYTEFLTATVNRSHAFSTDRIKQVFKIFDKNGDGKISLEELKNALGGENRRDTIFRKMIEEADSNGDGEIDLDEFIIHMRKIVDP